MLHGAVHRMASREVLMNGPGYRQAGSPLSESLLHGSVPPSKARGLLSQEWDFWVIRLALTCASVGLCFALRPFSFHGLPAAGLGFFIAMVILLAELRLRHAEISGLVGGAVRVLLGLLGCLLIRPGGSPTSEPAPTKSFIEFASLLSVRHLRLVGCTRC